MAQDFEFYVREVSLKFDYAFITLNFATLALSIQFSPSMGQHLPYVLVISWICFLLSGLFGGYRLMKQTVFYRLNLQRNEIKDFVNGRLQYLPLAEHGSVFEEVTNEQLSAENISMEISNGKKKLKQADENLEKLSKIFPLFFKFQLWCPSNPVYKADSSNNGTHSVSYANFK